MSKKISTFLITAVLAAALSGCARADQEGSLTGTKTNLQNSKENIPEPKAPPESKDVELVVWGAEEDEALLNQIFESFKDEYQGQANFQITFAAQSESGCKDALMADLEAGADVFAFADDQLNTLVAAGALEPVENADHIKSENLPGAVEAASVGEVLYAYPLTADNGYFLYYNKQYFNPEDIKTFDRMLQIAEENGKKITMDWSSAWYVYAFFGNTGLEVGLNDDGITNFCTWNGTEGNIKGVDVASAMLSIAQSPAFFNTVEAGFLAGIQDGSVIAAYSRHYEWASRLAEWISNEQNQQLRFEMRGQGPSNTKAAASPSVQDSLAITALIDQSEYSCLQRIGGNFWDPVTVFATNIAAGNPEGKNLQELLDTMVEGITAP